MIDLSNRRQLLGRFLFAAILAVVAACMLTAALYQYSLKDNLFGWLLVVPILFLRAAALFLIICPLVFLFGARIGWYSRVGLCLVVVFGAYMFKATVDEEYRGWKIERDKDQVVREASAILNDLRAGRISKYSDRVGSAALNKALEDFLGYPLSPAQLHEIVRWYVADDYVMAIVSKNPATAPDDLRTIFDFYQDPKTHKPVPARQDREETLSNLARNTRTPPEVLARLLELPWAAAAAATNPECPPEERQHWLETSSHGDKTTRLYAARSKYSSPDLLKSLAADPEKDVRVVVAGNPVSPFVALKVLSTDAEEPVRQAVAGNASCSPALLERLALDPSPLVRRAAARNLSTPVSVLTRLEAEDPDPLVQEQARSSLWARQEERAKTVQKPQRQ